MAVTLTTNEGAVVAYIAGKFDRSLPKGQFAIGRSGERLTLEHPSFHTAILIDVNTTVDGVSYATLEELAQLLSAFNRGGTGPTNGVQSVTGDLVDDTDPNNPVVNTPTGAQIIVNGVAVPGGGLVNGISVESLLFSYGNQINSNYARIPVTPETGTFVLKAVNGVIQWVEEV